MSATLIVATTYLPIPAGARSFTLRDDDVYYDLSDALSFSFYDQTPFSVGKTWRNTLDGNELARAWATGSLVGTSTAEVYDDRVQPVPASGQPTPSPIAPRNLIFTKTYIIFWDGSAGSGNVVAFVDAALFEQFSKEPPTRY